MESYIHNLFITSPALRDIPKNLPVYGKLCIFVAPSSGTVQFVVMVFCPFVHPSTFGTTLASTLMLGYVTLKPFEIFGQNLVQV